MNRLEKTLAIASTAFLTACHSKSIDTSVRSAPYADGFAVRVSKFEGFPYRMSVGVLDSANKDISVTFNGPILAAEFDKGPLSYAEITLDANLAADSALLVLANPTRLRAILDSTLARYRVEKKR